MSDYISKRAVFEVMSYVFNSYGNNALNFDEEETKAIKRFCAMLQSQIAELPTVDEKEIIRKAFERVVERLEEEVRANTKLGYELQAKEFHEGALIKFSKKNAFIEAIKILKEECEINERD